MPHRIFIALPISEDIKQAVDIWTHDYEKLPVRWISRKNLHVTMIPPWEESDVKVAKEKLNTISGKIGEFNVEFKKIVYGPLHRRPPNLIWASGLVPKQAVILKDELERIFAISNSRRSLFMHMTLARFNERHFSSFPVKHLDEEISWPNKVNSLILMESLGWSEYGVLHSVAL